MKKLLLAGFLSFAALSLTTAPASAWGLFDHCCGGKCCSVICCRQYNAFTPTCFGSITCIGCCPITSGCGMPAYSGPSYGYGNGYCDGGSCAASPGDQLPPDKKTEAAPFVAPVPKPVTTTSQAYPMGPAGVQPVRYQGGYYQGGYYPAPYNGYRPMMPQMYPPQGGYGRPMYPQPVNGCFPNAFFGGN
jgi:hypothetical protein